MKSDMKNDLTAATKAKSEMQHPQCNLLVPTRIVDLDTCSPHRSDREIKTLTFPSMDVYSMDTGKNIKEVDDDGALDRLQGVTFMELLGGEDDRLIDVEGEQRETKKRLQLQCSFIFSSFTSGQMICFNASEEEESALNEAFDMLSESSLSITSSAAKQEIRSCSTSSMKRTTLRKKPKPPGTCHPLPSMVGGDQVRQEKLHGRIAALWQLISTTERFAVKPDTASVLQQVMQHIKLLLQKVEILSSPYLHNQQVPLHVPKHEFRKDLKSRGLCLMPASSLENVVRNSDAYAFSLNEGLGQSISDCSSKH